MVFVGGAILPHGTMIFDGDSESECSACGERRSRLPKKLAGDTQALYNACCQTAQCIASKHPDIILLFTPHGFTLTSGSSLVYMSKNAAGNALWNECWDDIKLNINLDYDFSGQFLKHLKDQEFEVDGITHIQTLMPVPLRWGEVVPLWFVNKAVSSDVKYVIVSLNRHTLTAGECENPIDKCQRLGASVTSFLAQVKERVAVVISGDLSHTHPTDCNIPLYLPDRRWNMTIDGEHAREFDESAELWVKSRQQAELLRDQTMQDLSGVFEWKNEEAIHCLKKCFQLQNKAMSCGIYGFGVLHGILATESQAEGIGIRSRFFTRCTPTYYGMMCAYFEKHCSKSRKLLLDNENL